MIYEELYAFDDAMRAGSGTVIGVDEAGRGPLAGPVAVASVILDPSDRFEWLNDSKKVTEKRREVLYGQILERAAGWHVELIDNREIDRLNILGATMLGMKRCGEALWRDPSVILIDGNRKPEFAAGVCSDTVIKGDASSATIAAASVLAKVTRDRFMAELALQYPEYGFEIHKGYPTKAHYAAIKEHGVTPFHRLSFLKNLNEK